jgi:hypothetical protein
MIMKAGIAVAVALAGISVIGGAMAGDGNELLSACQKTVQFLDGQREGGTDVGYCFGLVNGVGTTMAFQSDNLPKNERICFPNGLKNEQSARIVARFLQNHPAVLHQDGAVLTIAAFQNAYPCK